MLQVQKIIFRQLVMIVCTMHLATINACELTSSCAKNSQKEPVSQLPALDITGDNLLFDSNHQLSIDDISLMNLDHKEVESSFLTRKIQEWAIVLFIQYILAKERFDSICYRVKRSVRSALFHF